MTQTENRRRFGLGTLIFALLGVALLATGLVWGGSTWLFLQGARPAMATVKWVTASEQDPAAFRPTVVFTDEFGQQHVAETVLASSEYNFEPGSQIEILYNLALTNNVRILGWTTSWRPGAIMALIGLFLLSLVRRRFRRAPAQPASIARTTPAKSEKAPRTRPAAPKTTAVAATPVPAVMQVPVPTVRRMR